MVDPDRDAAPASGSTNCPICRKPRPRPTPNETADRLDGKTRYHPFCSKRCADIDLGRWFSGDYAIPAVEPPDDWSEEF